MKNEHKALKQKYFEDVISALKTEFEIKNPMAVPKVSKVVVNMGTGERLRDKASRTKLIEDVAAITGQMPKVQAARVSIAGFGIRAGMPVGLSVTLRRDRMYHFLDRLISVVLPRLRDFKGISKSSFDHAGNYNLGLSEHTVFPEIDLAKVDRPHGIQITIVTSTKDKKQAER